MSEQNLNDEQRQALEIFGRVAGEYPVVVTAQALETINRCQKNKLDPVDVMGQIESLSDDKLKKWVDGAHEAAKRRNPDIKIKPLSLDAIRGTIGEIKTVCAYEEKFSGLGAGLSSEQLDSLVERYNHYFPLIKANVKNEEEAQRIENEYLQEAVGVMVANAEAKGIRINLASKRDN